MNNIKKEVPENVEQAIYSQQLTDDLTALTTFLTGAGKAPTSFEEYRERFLQIIELDKEFLELYTKAQGITSRVHFFKTVISIIGINTLVALIATGEINLLIAIISIPVGLTAGMGVSRMLPKNKLEKVVEETRRDLIAAGGPDLGGMRRIVRAGLNSNKYNG